MLASTMPDDDHRIGVDVGTDLTAATAAQVRVVVANPCTWPDDRLVPGVGELICRSRTGVAHRAQTSSPGNRRSSGPCEPLSTHLLRNSEAGPHRVLDIRLNLPNPRGRLIQRG